MKFLLPIILIGSAVAGFMFYINPTYTNIKSLKDKMAQYDTALANARDFKGQREKLNTKLQSIPAIDLEKLSTMLPDSVDNIRLILELDNTASVYGMSLKDVKYNTDAMVVVDPATTKTISSKILKASIKEKKDYGDWDLEFSTQGNYSNFLKFLNDLEHNLRIVDVVSVDFTSVATKTSTNGMVLDINSTENYKFNFKIKTYWLKN